MATEIFNLTDTLTVTITEDEFRVEGPRDVANLQAYARFMKARQTEAAERMFNAKVEAFEAAMAETNPAARRVKVRHANNLPLTHSYRAKFDEVVASTPAARLVPVNGGKMKVMAKA